jgi:hypothetical protein
VVIAGREYSEQVAWVTGISEGGAAIRDAPTAPVGARGTLSLAGFGSPLPFAVRSVQDQILRVSFELEPAGAGRLKPFLDQLASQRAA